MKTSMLTKSDINTIISSAKTKITNFSLPLYISGLIMEPNELASLAIIEATLMHLNQKSLSTEPVSVDYTDATASFGPKK